jgi:hypothetical protein
MHLQPMLLEFYDVNTVKNCCCFNQRMQQCGFVLLLVTHILSVYLGLRKKKIQK